MVTHIGHRRIYDNFKLGAATPEDESSKDLYLTFSDTDNELVHMFQVDPSSWEQFKNLVDQTMNKQKIEIPSSDMVRNLASKRG